MKSRAVGYVTVLKLDGHSVLSVRVKEHFWATLTLCDVDPMLSEYHFAQWYIMSIDDNFLDSFTVEVKKQVLLQLLFGRVFSVNAELNVNLAFIQMRIIPLFG